MDLQNPNTGNNMPQNNTPSGGNNPTDDLNKQYQEILKKYSQDLEKKEPVNTGDTPPVVNAPITSETPNLLEEISKSSSESTANLSAPQSFDTPQSNPSPVSDLSDLVDQSLEKSALDVKLKDDTLQSPVERPPIPQATESYQPSTNPSTPVLNPDPVLTTSSLTDSTPAPAVQPSLEAPQNSGYLPSGPAQESPVVSLPESNPSPTTEIPPLNSDTIVAPQTSSELNLSTNVVEPAVPTPPIQPADTVMNTLPISTPEFSEANPPIFPSALPDTANEKPNIFKYLFFISLFIFILIIGAFVYIVMTAPKLAGNNNTEIKNLAAIPSEGNFCELNDQKYKVGESFNAADGCNTCSCSSDQKIVCTTKDCSLENAPLKDYSSEMSKWKTYTNSAFGFSLKYPSTLKPQDNLPKKFTNIVSAKENLVFKSDDGKSEISLWINPDGFGPFFSDKTYELKYQSDKGVIVENKKTSPEDNNKDKFEIMTKGLTLNDKVSLTSYASFSSDNKDGEALFDAVLSTFRLTK